MDTVQLIFGSIEDFIFNWTTYFWSIPISFVIWTLLVKWAYNKVIVEDLIPITIAALINPVLYVGFICIIVFWPLLRLRFKWPSIKDKKIF